MSRAGGRGGIKPIETGRKGKYNAGGGGGGEVV